MIIRKLNFKLGAPEAYSRIRKGTSDSFILESAEKDKFMGRFSYISFNPDFKVKLGNDFISIGSDRFTTSNPLAELGKVVQANKIECPMPGFLWAA